MVTAEKTMIERMVAYICGIVGHRAVVGDEIADAGGRDQELGQHDADEARGHAQPQPGEDHWRRVGDDHLRDLLPARALERGRHIWIRDGLALRTAPNEFSTITGIAMMQTAITLEVRPMP